MPSQFFAEGLKGQLKLNDSYLQFKNWQIQGEIFGPNEPGLNEFQGSFEISNSDNRTLFSLWGQKLFAEFYGKTNYQGEIMIELDKISPNPIASIPFSGMGDFIRL